MLYILTSIWVMRTSNFNFFIYLVALECLYCYLINVYQSVCFTTHFLIYTKNTLESRKNQLELNFSNFQINLPLRMSEIEWEVLQIYHLFLYNWLYLKFKCSLRSSKSMWRYKSSLQICFKQHNSTAQSSLGG